MSRPDRFRAATSHPRARVAALLAVALLAAPAAHAEFLTNNIDLGTINDTGSCTRTIFTPGSSPGAVELRAVPTTIAAWGTGMDFATAIRSSNSAIRVRITERRNGPQNRGNRCPFTGSIGIELSPSASFRNTTSATITVEFPVGSWTFPVRMHANESDLLEWSIEKMLQPLERCMVANNGGFTNPSQRQVRNKRISIVVPRNFRIDTPACQGVVSSEIDLALTNVPITAFARGGFGSSWRFDATGPVRTASGRNLETRFGCTDSHRIDACGTLTVGVDWARIAALRHPSSQTVSVDVSYNGKSLGAVTIGVSTSAAVSTAPPNPPSGGGGTLPPPRGPIGVGGGSPPNVLPQLVSTGPLLRVIGGLQGNRMVSPTFCATLAQDQTRVVPVPALVWGASVVNADVNVPVRVELRSGNAVLSSFNTNVPLRQNANAQTRSNYTGRPTQVRVTRVVGQALRQQYANQTGCFIDRTLPADSPLAQVDRPDLRIVVDTGNAVDEGAAGEADNELPIG